MYCSAGTYAGPMALGLDGLRGAIWYGPVLVRYFLHLGTLTPLLGLLPRLGGDHVGPHSHDRQPHSHQHANSNTCRGGGRRGKEEGNIDDAVQMDLGGAGLDT